MALSRQRRVAAHATDSRATASTSLVRRDGPSSSPRASTASAASTVRFSGAAADSVKVRGVVDNKRQRFDARQHHSDRHQQKRSRLRRWLDLNARLAGLCSFVVLLGVFLYYTCHTAAREWRPADLQRFDAFTVFSRRGGEATFDYIVVGAGTTGSAVAHYLATSATSEADALQRPPRVLLLECGRRETWLLADVPLFAPLATLMEPTWGYMSAIQQHSHRGFRDARSTVPVGKLVGGTGQLNYMLHNISFVERDPDITPYLSASTTTRESPLLRALLAVGDGIAAAPGDYHADIRGARYAAVTNMARDGERWSTRRRFLSGDASDDVRAVDADLTVMPEMCVDEIQFGDANDAGDIRASSIRAHTPHDNAQFTLPLANQTRLILAAGAVNTPHLLMKSGIGPASELRAKGVRVHVDAPSVGANLIDQVALPLYFTVDQRTSQLGSINAASMLDVSQMWHYLVHRTGSWARTFIDGHALFEDDGLLLLFTSIGGPQKLIYQAVSNMAGDTFDQLFPGHDWWWQQGFIVLVTCLNSTSQGRVSFGLTRDDVQIDPNYLSADADVACLSRGLHLTRRIVEDTSEFQSENSTIGQPRLHLPRLERQCGVNATLDINDVDYVECWIRTAAMSMRHLAGTAAAGDVVDSDTGRVRGTSNVHVADASALPTLGNHFPSALLIHMAKRVAQTLNAAL